MNKDEMSGIISRQIIPDMLADYLTDHPSEIKYLAELALDETRHENWRAAWALDKINVRYPDLIASYIPMIIKELKKIKNKSKLRHFLKLISLHPIPVKSQGFLFNYCTDCFTSPAFPVAVKAHALQVLYEISKDIPELKQELVHIIKTEVELHATAGIKARSRNILFLLCKEAPKR